MALDLIGQATLFLRLAGQVEGKGRDEDALAYFREAVDFRNCQMVELEKGDFGFTIVRQFLFDAYAVLTLDALTRSSNSDVAGIAGKAVKEAKYHLRHSSEWVVKLGDGTEESHVRAQRALQQLWRFTGELFASDSVDNDMAAAGIGYDVSSIKPRWDSLVSDVMERAALVIPAEVQRGSRVRLGRNGAHTEFLGHMLAEMQIVARSHPGAQW